MYRLLFEKTGNSIWISHLDLMRVFQRAFKRANLPLTHTQGFNPRPSVSIALPLSVGVESVCELLDFELEGEKLSCEQIGSMLNDVLVSGIRVLEVYNTGRKLRELKWLRSHIILEYDTGVPETAVEKIRELFARESLLVPKRTKRGIEEQDIISMIHALTVEKIDNNTIRLDCVGCCQNPTLNPMQLPLAIETALPELKPDFSKSSRVALYDAEFKIFR